METKRVEKIAEILQSINWDFSDFSSLKYPLDINSIPWYPATFITPIPKFLVASLSQEGDVVLDPFGGKGTTAIESALQNRIPMYCDINPFIEESTEGLFAAIEYCYYGDCSLSNEKKRVESLVPSEDQLEQLMKKHNVNMEAVDWFHKKTLSKLMAIVESIQESVDMKNRNAELIKKLAFSAILKSASSQKGHFTYVTDNCKPGEDELVERDAIKLYIDKLQQIGDAAKEFVYQYGLVYGREKLSSLLSKRKIVKGDARDLGWIESNSIDLVVTSPPYLCSQDYIRTMRLINLFFADDQAFTVGVKDEIGARATRAGKSEKVVSKFYADMRIVFNNISRVLKKEGYFALVIGQGKSKVTSGYDIISDLVRILEDEFEYTLIFRTERHIGSRVIRVGGVDKESVLVFKR